MRRASRVKTTPLRVLADALVLFLLLYGTAFSFLSVFRPTVDNGLISAVLPVYALAFLTIFSLPRYRWAILLPLCVLYGFFLWQTWSTLALGEVSLRCSIVNLFAENFSFLTPLRPLAQLSYRAWEKAGTLTLLTFAAPLAALISWGLVRLRSFWLVFWCTFPVVMAPLVITKTPDWLPLMALVTCWAVLLTVSLAGRRDPEGRARLTLIALPAVAAFLAVLTLCLPREDYKQPAWAAEAQTGLVRSFSRLNLGSLFPGGVLPGPFGGGGFMAAAGSEDVDLSAAGPLSYTGKTVLKVQSSVPGKTYLRGYSAAVYDGTSWSALPDENYGLFEDFQPINFPALTAPGAEYYPITIQNIAAPDGCVYFPYQLVTNPTQVAGAEFVHDAYLARDRNIRKHTLYYKPDVADLADVTALTGLAAAAERSYRNFVYANYLGVPNKTQAGLGTWIANSYADNQSEAVWNAPAFADAPSASAREVMRAVEIAASLAASTSYDPATPVTPRGEDFITYFLNTSKKGYCMHYASAVTMLLRCFGIPARYVSGYVTDIPASGYANIADYAAHAWVEVYLDGYGWYPVDVTPGYSGGALPWEESTQVEPTPTPSLKPSSTPQPSLDPLTTPTPAQADAPGGSGTGLFGFDLRLLWIPGGLLTLLAIFVLRRALGVGLWDKRFHGRDCNRAVLAAYRYLLRIQRWGGTVPPEAESLAQKARFSQHGMTEEEREAMIVLLETQARKTDIALPVCKRLLYRYLFGLF